MVKKALGSTPQKYTTGTVMIQGNKIWKVDSSERFRRLFDEAILIRQEKVKALALNDTTISFLGRARRR